MADQEMHNKEPTQQGGAESVAAVAKDVADGLFESVGATIFSGLSFVQLVLLVVGATIPWYFKQTATTTDTIGLWKLHHEHSTGMFSDTFVQDIPCSKAQQYFKGAETFAIVSIFLALVSFLFGLITRARNGSIKIGGALLSVLTFGATLITWGIMARAYYQAFCGTPAWRDQHYFADAGLALYVSGWVLAFVNFIISIQDPKVPKLIPDALADKFAAIVFTLMSLVAFFFTVIGTPISAFSKWENDGITLNKITIWAAKIYVNGDMTSSTSLPDITCGDLPKYARYSEAFSIISIGATLFAFIAGVFATTGTAGKKAPLAVGFLAALATLIKFAADTAIYYREFCTPGTSTWPRSLSSDFYHMDAGFALFVAASALMWFGVILLSVISISQLVGSPVEGGNTSRTAFLFIFGTIISLTLMVVGLTQPVFSNTSGEDYVRITWWHIESRVATVFAKSDFTCKEEWQRLVGGGALTIIAIGFSLVAALLGIGQLSSGNLRSGASYVALFASIFQLVGWAVAVSDFWGKFCVGTNNPLYYPYYNHNFNVASGIGLAVAAWGVNLLVSILNLVSSP